MKTESETTKDVAESPVNALVMGLSDCDKALVEWGKSDGFVTNWHWNQNFSNWIAEYYPELNDTGKGNYDKARRAFLYRINKLVVKGLFEKCRRAGLGHGGERSFGVKTQSVWQYKYP